MGDNRLVARHFRVLKKLTKDKSKIEILKKWDKALYNYYKNELTNTFKVHLEIPHEYGGSEYIIAKVYNALTSAEAVRAVSNMFNLPEPDVLNVNEEFYGNDYGIIKVVREGKSKTFEYDEVEDIVEYILKIHYKQEILEGGKVILIDNKDEVLEALKLKYHIEIKREIKTIRDGNNRHTRE